MKLAAIALCQFFIFGMSIATLPCEENQSKGSLLADIFQKVANIFTTMSDFWIKYRTDAFEKLRSLTSLKYGIFTSIDSVQNRLQLASMSGKFVNFTKFTDYDKIITSELGIFQQNIDDIVSLIQNTTKFLQQQIDDDILFAHKSLNKIIKSKWNNSKAREDIFRTFFYGCDNYSYWLPSPKMPLFFIGLTEVELYSVVNIVNDNIYKVKQCMEIDFLKPDLKNEAQACLNSTLDEFPVTAKLATNHITLASEVLERSLFYINDIPSNLNSGYLQLSNAINLIKTDYSK